MKMYHRSRIIDRINVECNIPRLFKLPGAYEQFYRQVNDESRQQTYKQVCREINDQVYDLIGWQIARI